MPSSNTPKRKLKILFTTSTIPMSDKDPVPPFVRDEAIWMNKLYPNTDITVLAPHNAYSRTKKFIDHKFYKEYRFHYFWPFRWEKLAGRGIQPALKANKLYYLQLPALFIGEFFATWHYVKKLKPDILYAHWFTPQALTGSLVAKITGVRFAFDTQASDAIVLKKVPFSKKIVNFVCNQADAYTAPSQQTIDKLLYFSTPKNRKDILSKLHRVPYGTSPVKTTRSKIEEVRSRYNLKDCKIFYFIGRLVDRKGVNYLIEAFASISESNPQARLVIVGDGPYREELESLADKLSVRNKVIFTGFLSGETRYSLLELADVCVVPSINVGDQAEGLPVVFMEAVTHGKITVITDATGAHEIAKHRKNSFIVKAGSAPDLKAGMREALEASKDKKSTLYKNILLLSEQFQWPYVIKKRYEAITTGLKSID